MYTGKTLFAQLMDFLPWKPARQDKKKPQLITVGASVLVEVAGVEPASEGA